jgi:hypothetical protein
MEKQSISLKSSKEEKIRGLSSQCFLMAFISKRQESLEGYHRVVIITNKHQGQDLLCS